jgi:hypothetical protein
MTLLSPEKALVFQVTHLSNVPWILDHGLQSETTGVRHPHEIRIGNPELAEKRRRRSVPLPPGGSLADYVPFAFAPHPLLRDIKTGRNGVTRRPVSEIVILVSSLPAFAKAAVPFVFTDQHPSLVTAAFFAAPADLSRLDWPLWQTHEVERDLRDPDRIARWMAEALAHQQVPAAALHGVACYGDDERRVVEEMVGQSSPRIPVWTRPEWFL